MKREYHLEPINTHDELLAALGKACKQVTVPVDTNAMGDMEELVLTKPIDHALLHLILEQALFVINIAYREFAGGLVLTIMTHNAPRKRGSLTPKQTEIGTVRLLTEEEANDW